MKKSKSNSKKVEAPMVTRGKLLQETSQTSKLSESDLRNNTIDSTMDTEDSTAALSNQNSEQTDVMDEDSVDLSGKRQPYCSFKAVCILKDMLNNAMLIDADVISPYAHRTWKLRLSSLAIGYLRV